MKSIFKHIVALLFLVVAIFFANAQHKLLVSLETVLQLAGANNLTVHEYQLKYQKALAEQSKSKEWWLPHVYGGASTHVLKGSVMNTDGNILTDVNRNNLWAGLGIFAEINFNKGIYQSLSAKQKLKAANYFSIAERNKAILKAVQNYFDLQAEQFEYAFLQSLVNQADTLSQQIKVKMDAGLLYQSDYLVSQSNYNHLKLSMLQAKMEWQKKSADLVNALNLENNIILVSADTILIPILFTLQQIDTNGFEKRPEYLGLHSELQSFQILRKTANQGLLLPTLRVGYDNGVFGAYSTPRQNTYQFNASLLWSFPLGRLIYNGDLKKNKAHILIQQNKIEQFKNKYQQEIAIATSQMQIVEEQMRVAKQALQFSKEALNQSVERQKLGIAKPVEVFQAQQFFIQAQVDYLKTISKCNKSYFAFKVAKGELL